MDIAGKKLIIKALAEEKVDTVFAYPGGMIVDIMDELYIVCSAADFTCRFNQIRRNHTNIVILIITAYIYILGKVIKNIFAIYIA